MTVEAAESTLNRLQDADRRRTDELNSQGGGLFLMGGFSWENEDLVEEGSDVTRKYIHAPPGEASIYRRLGAWLADNLGKAAIGVLSAVALAVLLTWLKLKK